jgi:universal stress protein E
MKRILVFAPAEDRRGRAVWLAAALARRTGASLTLVRVLEETGSGPAGVAGESGGRLRDLLLETERCELARLADTLRAGVKEPLSIESEVHWGVAWEVLIGLVERHGYDLLVEPARGLSHSGRVFFGATALHLFRRCSCPVWVVGDDGHLPQRVLVAIDPSPDATRRAMGAQLLAWAETARSAGDADLEIVSTWDAAAADALKAHLDPSEHDRYLRDALGRAEEGLQSILDENPVSGRAKRVNLLRGSARDIVPAFAEDREFDLIVVGTLARTGLAGELLGETAEMILRGVHCSVLVVAPKHPVPARARSLEPDPASTAAG